MKYLPSVNKICILNQDCLHSNAWVCAGRDPKPNEIGERGGEDLSLILVSFGSGPLRPLAMIK